MSKRIFVRLISLFSWGLVLAAVVLSRVLAGKYFPYPLELTWQAVGLVLLGAGLLMALIYLLIRVDRVFMPGILEKLRPLKPVLLELNQIEIMFISSLAGFSEELFFRGVLQPLLGITAVSILFGLLHAVTFGYFLLAAGLGFSLGGLYQATDNLLVPMAVHALYDIFALNLLVHLYRQEERKGDAKSF